MNLNIILIIIDALRQDHLGVYGYDKPTSPFLDRLAKDGILFTNAFSATNCTDPSLTSLATGLYPSFHGVVSHGEHVTRDQVVKALRRTFMQEILKEHGYVNVAIDFLVRWHRRGYDFYLEKSPEDLVGKSGKAVLFTRKILNSIGLSQSFDYVNRLLRDLETQTKPFYDAMPYTKLALRVLKHIRGRKFFLFLHYWNTHIPYIAPKNTIEYFKKFYRGDIYDKTLYELISSMKGPWRYNLINMLGKEITLRDILASYDATIKYTDEMIKAVYRALEILGLLDKTLIIITSDHGESLTEHDIFFDHHGLYDVSVHVPLIMLGPDISGGKRIKAFVQHIDILPTLLNMLEIKKHIYMNGIDLTKLIYGEEDYEPRSNIFLEEGYTERKFAVRTERFKYIFTLDEKSAICRYCGKIHGDIEELYDLTRDPGENINIIDDERDIAERLRREGLKILRKARLFDGVMKIRSSLKGKSNS